MELIFKTVFLLNRRRILSIAAGLVLIALVQIAALGSPRENTAVSHDHTVFNATNQVTKTNPNYFMAKPIGWQLDTAEASNTNVLTITATRIEELVNPGTGTPTTVTWTNTEVVATITTTNNAAGAIDVGAISSDFYIKNGDSVTYSNSVATNAILTIHWQY